MGVDSVYIAIAILAILVVAEAVMLFNLKKALRKKDIEIEEIKKELEKARNYDEISGAYNYPFFVKMANLQIKMARRHKWPVTLMIIDINGLEKINLRYNFKTGDAALKHLFESISGILRSSDVVGRFGGSGFFILLPECDFENIESVKDRVEQRIENSPLSFGNNIIDYKRSYGAVTMYGVHIHLNRMLELAEDALSRAKEKRKEIVIFDKEGTEI